MPFIDRHTERGRIDMLVRDVIAGRPERHLALVGPRRIGKTSIIEAFLSAANQRSTGEGPADASRAAVAYLKVDGATATISTYLEEMVRAIVSAHCRRAGRPEPDRAASATTLVMIATGLGIGLERVIAPALDLAAARRPDGHQLFVAATTLPETAAKETGIPTVVLADEFQHIVDLGAYAPFRAPGRGGSGGRAGAERILNAFRASVERAPHVGWIVTGSSIRLMGEILGKGPLMGRFDMLAVGPFGRRETRALAAAVWEEQGVAFDEEAADRVEALTGGHPFYADVVCRRSALEAYRTGTRRVVANLVDLAMVASLHDPNGAIWIACQETWDSLMARRAALRGLVQALARLGHATASELAEAIGLPNATAVWPQIREIEQLGLVVLENAEVRLVDHVFRYWLTIALDPTTRPDPLADEGSVRRLVTRYEELFQAERAARGHHVEAWVRDVARGFAGQSIEGRRFGSPGRHIRVPTVDLVRRAAAYDGNAEVRDHPSEVELDLCFGQDEVWLGEVRDRGQRPGPQDIDLLVRKDRFLRRVLGLAPGPTWFVSLNGFGKGARERAEELGVLLSNDKDIEAIGAEVGVLRPPA